MTTGRAVLIGASLLSAAIVVHAFFGRFDAFRMQVVAEGAGFVVRLDRLTGEVRVCQTRSVPVLGAYDSVRFDCSGLALSAKQQADNEKAAADFLREFAPPPVGPQTLRGELSSAGELESPHR